MARAFARRNPADSRFLQITRTFGIYLVLATQRPSAQVITGDIKANLTARVALKVQSSHDSRTILITGALSLCAARAISSSSTAGPASGSRG